MPGYVVTVKGGHLRTVVVAGKNVTVTGVGTHADPYIISAQIANESGEPVPLVVNDPATEAIPMTATRNPDGSVSLQGAFDLPGPLNPGEPTTVMKLPDGYLPSIVGAYAVAADVGDDSTHVPVAARVVLEPDGYLTVVSPMVNDGIRLTVFLYSLTYWPAVK
jgi:hypothetical protein